ncbi:MAG: trigger factor [Leptospiraceae bacterium]|nr:trigger factor [Leptospiraceae bacterium]
MEYSTKKNKNATVDLTVHFTAEELEQGFQKAYEKARHKAKVPGFRVGKAPLKTVEKLLGDSVAEDAINFSLNEGIIEFFPKLDPKPFRMPKFNVDTFDRTKGFTAKTVYLTYPEVTLPKIKKVKIEPYQVTPSSADIQKELEAIQKNMARNVLKEEGEVLQTGNLIEMSYKFSLEGSELPVESTNGKYQIGDERNPQGFDEKILGMKVGETRTFLYTYPSDFPISPESAGKTYQYEITCTAAYNVNYPAIDDDFASEYDGSENLETLKSKLQESLAKSSTEELKKKSMTEIYNKLIDDAKFIIPDELIAEEAEFVYQTMFEQYKIPFISMEDYAKSTNSSIEETKEKFTSMGLKRLQGYFLRQKIAEEEKISVPEEELKQKLEDVAKVYGQTYEAFLQSLQKDGRLGTIQENILMEKVDNFVYESVEKKNPKVINLEEASKILNGEKQV